MIPQDSKFMFREKPVVLLTSLLTNGNKKNYAQRLSRENDITNGHIVHTMRRFKEMDLVRMEKNGRTNHIFLTEKGRSIALNFNNIFEVMENEN